MKFLQINLRCSVLSMSHQTHTKKNIFCTQRVCVTLLIYKTRHTNLLSWGNVKWRKNSDEKILNCQNDESGRSVFWKDWLRWLKTLELRNNWFYSENYSYIPSENVESTSKVNWNSLVCHFRIRWCGLYFSWLAQEFHVSCLKQPFTSLIVDLPWYEQAYKLMAYKLYYTILLCAFYSE